MKIGTQLSTQSGHEKSPRQMWPLTALVFGDGFGLMNSGIGIRRGPLLIHEMIFNEQIRGCGGVIARDAWLRGKINGIQKQEKRPKGRFFL